MSNLNDFALNKTATFTRSIMRNVYIWMTIALAITGVVAYGISQNLEFVVGLHSSGLIWALIIGQVIMVFALSGFVMKMSPTVATLVFAGYAVLNGITLSYIFLLYELGSIFKAFFVAAGAFGVMSVYAVTTKRDLSGWGTYLFMGAIGLFIAGIVNMFLQSSAMDYIISGIGILVFTGLTAYDTQQIKRMSDSYGDSIVEADYIRLSIVGALKLYLDFINLFIYLLRFLGVRRD